MKHRAGVAVSAKGIVTGNDPADRLLESLRGRPGDPWSQEEAKRLVEWKREVRRRLGDILAAERRRTIASVRGRLRFIPDEASRRAVVSVLDEMEGET